MNHLKESQSNHADNNEIMVKRFKEYDIAIENDEIVKNANLAIKSLLNSLTVALENLKSLSNS